jgi:magnesium transporter
VVGDHLDDVLDVVGQEATETSATSQPRRPGGRGDVAQRSVRAAWLWSTWPPRSSPRGWSAVQETIAGTSSAVFAVVAGMGGNAGTQTLTVIVRAIALGEMDLRRSGSVVARQTLVGLLNGLATGAVLGLCALAWERNLALAAICSSWTANLTVAGLFGAAVPSPAPCTSTRLSAARSSSRRLLRLRLPRHLGPAARPADAGRLGR